MSRKNADPLVGLPSTTRKVYSAAETKKVDMKALKFRKRAALGHFSMYVRGFEVDTIAAVEQVSQNGQIPREWTDLVGWKNTQAKPPPEAFWRTLVADRGIDGKNPPVYYSRACAESFKKGGYESGAVNTSDLINWERNSVVSQFCRRVQAVVWNRALVKTEKGRFGLVGKDVEKGDKVCILYGLSVPVILRRSDRKEDSVFQEEMAWELGYIQTKIRDCFKQYKARKRDHERRKDKAMLPLVRQWFEETRSRRTYLASESWDARSSRCHTIKSEWEKALKETAYAVVRNSLVSFREWRANLRKAEWEELEKGSVDGIDALRAKDAKHRQHVALRTGASSDMRADRTSLGRGHEKGNLPTNARSTEPSKERNSAALNAENKKAHMDWWGFELALKAGRRWRRIVAIRKKYMAEELKAAVERNWEIRRKQQFASFEERRRREGKWIPSAKENGKQSSLPSIKRPVRSKTHSDRNSGEPPLALDNPKTWAKYGPRRPFHHPRKISDLSQDAVTGADMPLGYENSDATQRTRPNFEPTHSIGIVQRLAEDALINPRGLSVEETYFDLPSPIHEEPTELPSHGLDEGSKPSSHEQQTNQEGTIPQESSELYDGDGGPDIPVSSESRLHVSVATLLGDPSSLDPNLSSSSEATHATLVGEIPLPISAQSEPNLPSTFSRAPTAFETQPKAPIPASTNKSSPPQDYRASWNPPKKVYERMSEADGEIVIEEMKEWLKTEIFKEDGYHSYELLGECYIHGIMDGEAMLYQNEGDDESEVKDEQGKSNNVPSVVYEIR